MSKLADKDDVSHLSRKVDSLKADVAGHGAEIDGIKFSMAEEKEKNEERFLELERKV